MSVASATTPVRLCAEDSARIVVAATKVSRADLARTISFAAELKPWQEIELHARTTGYLDVLKVDAGDLVKEDQLIAMLDVPEFKSDIEHALASERSRKAEIEHAQAAYEDAHLVYTRLQAVDKQQPNLIAQQDLDAARSKDRAASAALSAAKEQALVAEADVKKLRVMESYMKITAPFTGVITKRYADPGALIQAGTSTGSLPLVRLSQNDKLRCVFPVSVSYVAQVKLDQPVEIQIDSSINRTIAGKVARFSRKVETSTRTMDVEVDVENQDLSLTPGMYARVDLQTETHKGVLIVPVEAVSVDKTGVSTSYVITKEKKLEVRTVRTGLQTSERIEIQSGLDEGDLVMTSSRSVARPGDAVEPKVREESQTAASR